MNKQKRIVSSLLCGAFVALSPSLLFSQTINYWKPQEGEWGNPFNWFAGAPQATDIVAFGLYTGDNPSYDGLQTVNADIDATFAQLNVGYGQAARINLEAGVTLNVTSSTTINTGRGTGKGASALTISATNAENVSNINFGAQVTLGGHQGNGSDGSSLILEGAGLRADFTSTTSSVRIGSARNGNSLVVRDGAHFDSSGIVYVGHGTSRSPAPTEKGHDNLLSVTGAGTKMTVNRSGVGLGIGSVASGDTSPVTGNTAEVTDGGFLRVSSTSATATAIEIATPRYVRDSSLNVSGAGSRLEVAANSGSGIKLGARYNDSRNNRITISDGGTLKNEGSLEILNTWSGSGGSNHMRVGNGGTYIGSGDIRNHGGIIYLDNGGALIGKTADGSDAQTIAINLIATVSNQLSTLYVEGAGLGSTVNVNAEDRSIISLGDASNGSVAALILNSAITMDEGSTLQFVFFEDSYSSIDFGETGSLSGATTLAISFTGYTAQSGDEWALFTGNISGIDSNFDFTVSPLPSLADGLEWDLSRLNAEGGWTIGVVPEPSTSAMMIGAGVLAAALFVRRRSARKQA